MKELTCGERCIRCLLGEPIDRVPFGVWFGWQTWGGAYPEWQTASGDPDLDYTRVLGYDAAFALPQLHAGIFPRFTEEIVAEDENFIVSRDWRGILMRNRRDGGSMPEFLEYPVQTPEDWERLKHERLNPDMPGRVVQDWDAFRARLAQGGEAVQVGEFPFGIFGTPRDLLGAEELLVAFYTEPAMVRDMMHYLTTLWLSLWERVAAEVQIDHIHIWEDMSGKQGSLISPAMTEEFMMPCYDRIADFACRHNVRLISVDTDGDCSELVPLMAAHGVNVFLPFEVQAGNDIRDYRRQYPHLGIIGGLDKRALAGTKADVDIEVAKAAEMLKTGRYLPSLDHLIPPDATWANFSYFAQEIKRLCYTNQ